MTKIAALVIFLLLQLLDAIVTAKAFALGMHDRNGLIEKMRALIDDDELVLAIFKLAGVAVIMWVYDGTPWWVLALLDIAYIDVIRRNYKKLRRRRAIMGVS